MRNPPPLSTRVDHAGYANYADTTDTGKDVNPGQTAQDADDKEAGQNIDPSETEQDADASDDPGEIAHDEKFFRETLFS